MSVQNKKPGLLTLTIKDKSALYLAYMPFLTNGVIERNNAFTCEAL